MNTTLSTPAQWAQQEFALARLGDQRRTQRLVKIATRLAQNPGGTLPQALPRWKELKAAYRFFSQPKVGPVEVQTPHWEATRARCREPGEYLLIEDTTQLDYSFHPATQGLGPIGNGGGRGLLLHTTLAVRVEHWTLDQRPEGIALGLFFQQSWVRTGPPKRGRETWRQRLKRPRQSQCWTAALDQTPPPPVGSQWIFMADREADFYEPIAHCQRHGVDFIIRSYRDRAQAAAPEHLQQAAGQLPVRGTLTVVLRARPATVQVRSGPLTLKGPERPGDAKPDFTVNVVEARELNAPPGVQALHWTLLSSLPCEPWVEAQRIVGRYTARWWIEEYHKALKSGAGVEASQLEAAYRIETLASVLAIVAVRLLNAQWLARARPEEAVEADAFGPQALALLAAEWGEPPGGWTHRRALVAVARLGGFLARKGDGQPGWQTIWRGWQRLMWMCQGLETLQRS
jgi:Transposase DNA-binding/Transposase DDE domain